MSEKCFWCNKNANQLNKIEIKFRGKLKESKICSPDCEVKLRRLSEYADTHIKYYILGLTLSFLIGLVVVFWRFNVDKGALGVLIILAGAGLTLIKYPFVTSQTVNLIGVKKAVVTGRILGAISIILGIVFWLGLSQYFSDRDLADYVANNYSSVSRDYCQQDSDCVLVPQYQGCCAKGCKQEAVNIETKKSEEEIRNIQCGTKDYDCRAYKCPLVSYTNPPFCKQNQCVNEERTNNINNNTLPIETNLCGPEPPAACGVGMRLTCLNGKWDCRKIQASNTGNKYSIIGSFTSPGESSFVKVLGSTAYLTDISEGLLAIDVSNPEKPVLLDKIKIGNGGAYALAVNPTGLFAVAGGYGNTKVALINIRDPKNLRILSEIDAKRSVQDLDVVANNVYLAIDGPEIEVLTLKFTESIGSSIRWLEPTLILKSLFQIQGGGHAIGTAVLDINIGDLLTHNLIIAQGESGVGVYEKAEFVMPRFNFVSKVGYVSVVDADENYVYAGVGNSIKVIDIKTQKQIADIKVDDVWNFKVKNKTLYVASGENGVKVLDISDIKNPKQIAIIDTPGRARGIDVSDDGNYIYVADDRDDLQIISAQ